MAPRSRNRTLLLLAAAGALLSGCGGASSAASTSTAATAAATAPPATTRPTTPTTTPTTATTMPHPTTTAYTPSGPEPSPDDAAYRLISAWSVGNRAEAAAVAAPGAVAALFALPYPGDSLQARGCSEGFSPADCDYRDGDRLLKIYATQLPRGWYVSSIVLES